MFLFDKIKKIIIIKVNWSQQRKTCFFYYLKFKLIKTSLGNIFRAVSFLYIHANIKFFIALTLILYILIVPIMYCFPS